MNKSEFRRQKTQQQLNQQFVKEFMTANNVLVKYVWRRRLVKDAYKAMYFTVGGMFCMKPGFIQSNDRIYEKVYVGTLTSMRVGNQIFYGFAKLNSEDRFNKKTGLKIAIDRMLASENAEPITKMPNVLVDAFSHFRERSIRYFKVNN